MEQDGLHRCILSKFYIKPQHITPDYLSYRVVSYRNSTSNHNPATSSFIVLQLYLIEILHQTTTQMSFSSDSFCCILSKFYIKPQHICRQIADCPCCILSKFYIKPQQQIALPLRTAGCILSKFYIKPQQGWRKSSSGFGCILSKFYIKPQLNVIFNSEVNVVSYRNSTSNHNTTTSCRFCLFVVSYRNSTSNHNKSIGFELDFDVVSYRNSTSNHNEPVLDRFFVLLYLIEILHQTTTPGACGSRLSGCILSKFYIKPQQRYVLTPRPDVVSYRNSTSNHNMRKQMEDAGLVVSYRNSTSNHNCAGRTRFTVIVVSYRNSTSNHNT